MRIALVSLALLLVGHAPAVRAQVPVPPLEARVTDLTGTLTASQQSGLEEKLAAFERRKGSQVAVLILPTTQPEDIAQFGIRLGEAWKIGRAGPDDGAILIVAKDDRAMRIEVGRGLEGALTDVIASRILNDTITPLFKQGDFNGGVNAGLDQIIRVIDGEPLPAPDQSWKRRGWKVPTPMLLFLGIALLFVLNRFLGRGPVAAILGIGGAIVSYRFTSEFLNSVFVGVGIFLAVRFFALEHFSSDDDDDRRVYRDSGRSGGFGGGWSGRSGGSSRGGGFSGGGGSFGGGGASGRW